MKDGQLELLPSGPARLAPTAIDLKRPRVGRTDLDTSRRAAERVSSEVIASRQMREVLRQVVINPGLTATELGRVAPNGILGRDSAARRLTIARRMSELRALKLITNVVHARKRESVLFPTALGIEEVKSW